MNEKNLAELVVRDYFKYLYEANTVSIVDLYFDAAVLMPADLPTATGKAELITAYDQTFKTTKFVDAITDYDEVSVYEDIAIVRTTSHVNLFLINEKQEIKSKMREFFILKRVNDKWKISLYMFNRQL